MTTNLHFDMLRLPWSQMIQVAFVDKFWCFVLPSWVFSVKRISLNKNRPPTKKFAVLPFPNCPLSAYYMTSWTFWGANIDFGLGKSWQQKLLRKELGRAGSREFGRAGSRELGRAGSRELGRAGSKEAGTAEALDFCGENLRFSTWLPQVSSGDLGEFLLLSMCWTFSKWSCDVFFFQDLYNRKTQPRAFFFHRNHRPGGKQQLLCISQGVDASTLSETISKFVRYLGLKMAVLPPAEVNQRHSSHKIPWDWYGICLPTWIRWFLWFSCR